MLVINNNNKVGPTPTQEAMKQSYGRCTDKIQRMVSFSSDRFFPRENTPDTSAPEKPG
jgi:hypothetical protein